MGRKIFVSYKHEDNSVQYLEKYGTARDYVEYLIELFEGEEIYKGEGDEDVSEFKDETIKNRLKDKIHDSSITLVLLSPHMKDNSKKESEQFIPWEISYSLKEIIRNDKKSHPNAIIAVVLPDRNNSYDYYIKDNICEYCNCRTLKTNTLFQILQENMFNTKEPIFSDCKHHEPNTVYTGEHSYILSVKWKNFIKDKDHYLEKAIAIRDNRKSYDIVKEFTDD